MKNQMMQVNLGNFGSVVIGHKTMLGLAQHIEKIGNEIREQKGLNPKKLDTFMRKESTWEKIIKVNNEENSVNDCNIKGNKTFSQNREKLLYNTIKDLPRYKDNTINHVAITKTGYFDHILKRQTRGKLANRGTWMHLILLLDYAEWYDVSLWYEVHKQFIEGKILQLRDEGGEAFKALNEAIDTLPDRSIELKPKGNKGVYMQVSLQIRRKLEIVDTFGYNEEDHDSFIQKMRENILELLTQNIKLGFITSYPQLKDVIKRFEIVKK